MNHPKHRLHLVNEIAYAPKQLLYSQLSLKKSQEIKIKKIKKAAYCSSDCHRGGSAGTASAGKQTQCSRLNAGAMTSSSRTKMKIKFPSPAKMIDDGKGRRKLWGKGRKAT